MRPTFNELSLKHKLLLLEDLGIELMSIEHYDHRIFLYEFNNLFVECYQNIDSREFETIRVCTFNELDKFLSRITLPLHKWNTRRSNFFGSAL
jgi:hypothetical protein